ncbi:acetamidase/formamidase family protein [Vulcanisaeta thermophila]|uniref:acetamidase/formamidase family protein n=1 Tax=Vulcanisaeta thermophila TaxID=867917 RepID=UPI000A06B5CB|nr:acetamidase/formamidase family protein [Vulcanisaeta thermophila]
MAIYTIHAITHNKWDNSLTPILKVRSGDEVEVETKEASDGQVTPNSTAQDLNKLDFSRIHPLTGPIEVEGAEPGDALEIEFLEFRDMGWGWTGVIPGFGLLAQDQYTTPIDLAGPALKIWSVRDGKSRARFGSVDVEIPNRPFPGVIGTALPYRGRWSTIPPRENGGNMDIKQLTVGSILYLPVFVPGALLSIGDTHLAQGDGEACGTAIEAPMRVRFRVRLIKNVGLKQPIFKFNRLRELTFNEYIAYPGIAPNLWDAVKEAVKGIINILSKFMTPVEAYMLSSVAVDLKVSEVVDVPNWIVTAFFPLDIIINEDVKNELRKLIT